MVYHHGCHAVYTLNLCSLYPVLAHCLSNYFWITLKSSLYYLVLLIQQITWWWWWWHCYFSV